MHIHASVLDAIIVFFMVVVTGAIWRWIAAKNSDNAIGQAMASLY